MIDEWEKQPFISIRLQDRECTYIEDDYIGGETIFWREWLGTEKGCYIYEVVPERGRTIPAMIRTYEDWENRDRGQECNEIVEAIEPVVQKVFKGNHFCGIRGGDPFVSVRRPLLSTG